MGPPCDVGWVKLCCVESMRICGACGLSGVCVLRVDAGIGFAVGDQDFGGKGCVEGEKRRCYLEVNVSDCVRRLVV